MSMTHCVKYLVDLREQNQRIHKLQGDIDRFTRNEHHCEILVKEYNDACKELERLSEKWNQDYVPAIERGQRSRSELYAARNQPEIFQRLIHEELTEKDSVQIRSKIKALQDSMVITQFSIEMQCSKYPEKTRSDSDEPENTSVHKFRRSHSSWALRTAIEQVKTLEEQHKELSLKMRYVGSHSCALSAQLKVIKKKLNDLKEAMKHPAEMLYKDLEKELSSMKIQAYEEYLSKQSSSNQLKFKLNAVNTQRDRGHSSFIYRQEHARSRSDVTLQSSPSLTASLASTLTDFSSVGNDFLKSTEATLDEVTARWRVPGY